MNYLLILNIAKSLLLARWKQTLVAAIGVTFSITMFITLLSFMTGLNGLLDALILNRTPHIRLFNEIKPNNNQPLNSLEGFNNKYNFIHSIKSSHSRQEIYNSAAIIQTVRNDERVLGLAPRITSPVFFNDGSVGITGVINGIDVSAEIRLFHFKDYITLGSGDDLNSISNSIVLGKPLAEKLLINLGDIVQVTTANGERFPLKVVGLFESGLKDFDKVQSYASLATVQKLVGKTSAYITDIQIKLNDIKLAPELAKEYAGKLKNGLNCLFQIANWQFGYLQHPSEIFLNIPSLIPVLV